jgi:hypothetical protein
MCLGARARTPTSPSLDRSATRYTCYAQRNGPGSGSSIACPMCLGARNWTCEVNRARPQAVGVGCGDKTAAAAWSPTPNPFGCRRCNQLWTSVPAAPACEIEICRLAARSHDQSNEAMGRRLSATAPTSSCLSVQCMLRLHTLYGAVGGVGRAKQFGPWWRFSRHTIHFEE